MAGWSNWKFRDTSNVQFFSSEKVGSDCVTMEEPNALTQDHAAPGVLLGSGSTGLSSGGDTGLTLFIQGSYRGQGFHFSIQLPVLDLGHLAGDTVLCQWLSLTPHLTFSPGSPISPGCPCKTKRSIFQSPPLLCPWSLHKGIEIHGDPCKIPSFHWTVKQPSVVHLSFEYLGPNTSDLLFVPYEKCS